MTCFTGTTVVNVNSFDGTIIEDLNDFKSSSVVCYVEEPVYWTIHTGSYITIDTGVAIRFKEGT